MFEISFNEITFKFSQTSICSDLLTLKNTHDRISYAYKIKTTNPQLFEVTPSKGVLHPAQMKKIEFKTKRILSVDEASSLNNKDKFLIQYIDVSDKKKPQEVEEQWMRYKRDSINIESMKLKVVFNELTNTQSSKPNSQELPFRSIIKDIPQQSLVIKTDFSDLGQKLEKLKQKQAKLEQQRKEAYQSIVTNEKKKHSKSGGSRLIVLLVFFVLGLASKKYVYDKYNPKTTTPISATDV